MGKIVINGTLENLDNAVQPKSCLLIATINSEINGGFVLTLLHWGIQRNRSKKLLSLNQVAS